MATIVNTDNTNIRNNNTGTYNIGSWNAGSFNVGSGNEGNGNSGNNNVGYWNTGSFNVGDYNTGSFNVGDYNSGYFNTGDHNSGIFNMPFPEGITAADVDLPNFLTYVRLTEWIPWEQMDACSRKEHPEDEGHGGYLLVHDLKEAVQKAWVTARQGGEEEFKDQVHTLVNLPNFDPEIFEQITGISRDEIEKV